MRGDTDSFEGFSVDMTLVSSKLRTLAEGEILLVNEYDEFVMAMRDISDLEKSGLIHQNIVRYDITGVAKPIKL